MAIRHGLFPHLKASTLRALSLLLLATIVADLAAQTGSIVGRDIQLQSAQSIQRYRRTGKRQLSAPGDEISQRLIDAAVRYVDHLYACHLLKQLAREVGETSVPRRAIVHFVRTLTLQLDQLTHIADGQ